ncbi:hypothetical protein BDN72DRAFT_846102 [Pluteus cervinus]|uniref:Uncharacterized protein n=1 Tax=Pluteus cervinus TaxID=181527 RepID=A0ACD3AHG2_9AGAR|nr:hypothetical protein BDN72DRAFT_846102 [Pluteus cervinus]
MQDPRFPPELEYKVFLTAFHRNFNDLQSLLLVAKRVHDWLLPKAFEVVILSRSRMFPVYFDLEKFRKYGRLVRALCIGFRAGEDETLAMEYLSLCPNLTNLVLILQGCPTRLSDTLAVLPLTRLYIDGRALVSNPPSPHLPQVFSNITHLRVLHSILPLETSNGDSVSLPTLFPRLTHVAFSRHQYRDQLRDALQGCVNLKVIILWCEDGDMCIGGGISIDKGSDILPPPVLLCCEGHGEWEDNARGIDSDMWEVAEKVLCSYLTPD